MNTRNSLHKLRRAGVSALLATLLLVGCGGEKPEARLASAKEELGKKLEQAAKKVEEKQKEQDKKDQQAKEKVEEEIRRLEKKKDEAKAA